MSVPTAIRLRSLSYGGQVAEPVIGSHSRDPLARNDGGDAIDGCRLLKRRVLLYRAAN